MSIRRYEPDIGAVLDSIPVFQACLGPMACLDARYVDSPYYASKPLHADLLFTDGADRTAISGGDKAKHGSGKKRRRQGGHGVQAPESNKVSENDIERGRRFQEAMKSYYAVHSTFLLNAHATLTQKWCEFATVGPVVPPPPVADNDWLSYASLAKIAGSFSCSEAPPVVELNEHITVASVDELFNTPFHNQSAEYKYVQRNDRLESMLAIPPHSGFLMSDITAIDLLLPGKPAGGYEVIVMDPPWPNKSVTRANAYDTIDRRCLLYLPVTNLLSPTGLVAVWVTNKIAHIQFVRRSLFKAWGLTEVAEWWWIKVTSSGHHVVEPGCLHRHPYEILLIGRRPSRGGEAKTSHRALVCPPIKQHSRKPPLTEMLEKNFPSLRAELPSEQVCKTRYLELFARHLTPGWMCWGNEVLKYQQVPMTRDTTSRGGD